MTQTLIRIGLALVVLLAVAGVVGIASAEMAPGVDEQHAHGGEQAHNSMDHEHVDRHVANGTDRDAGDCQHGQQGAHQHGADERHGQHETHEQRGQHGVDERHGQHDHATGLANGQ